MDPPKEPKRRGRKKKSMALSKGSIGIGKGKRKKISIVLPMPSSKRLENEELGLKLLELFNNTKELLNEVGNDDA